MSKTLNKAVEQFKRDTIAAMLTQCTQQQRDFWDCIFPGGVPEHSLDTAYDLVERTLAKRTSVPSVAAVMERHDENNGG